MPDIIIDSEYMQPLPGRHARKRPLHADVADKLRDNVGVWFDLGERPSQNSAWAFQQQIATGRRVAFRPPGHFEASCSGLHVHARYVGEEGVNV